MRKILRRGFTHTTIILSLAVLAGCRFGPTNPTDDTTTTEISAVATQAGQSGIFVSVVDQDGVPIDAARFSARSFGIAYAGQTIAAGSIRVGTAGNAGQAVSTGLVLDYSGSMSFDRPNLEVAATSFISNMAGPDRAEVIKFDTNVVVTQPFTVDKTVLLNAIPTPAFQFGGATALYDAIYQGILDTERETGQRAVIAFTDGLENASRIIRNPSDLISRALTAALPIYTVGLGAVNDAELQNLAVSTGGRYYRAPTSGDLSAIYQQISRTFAQTMLISWPDFVYQPGATITLTITYIGNGVHTTTVTVTLR